MFRGGRGVPEAPSRSGLGAVLGRGWEVGGSVVRGASGTVTWQPFVCMRRRSLEGTGNEIRRAKSSLTCLTVVL